ncbi:MAG: secretin N-terminal domain-containing protein, partial [Candidatus Hydrogenedentota bacterium]
MSINELGTRLAKASQTLEDSEVARMASSLERLALDEDQPTPNLIGDDIRTHRALAASAYRDLAFRFATIMDEGRPNKIGKADATELEAQYESYNRMFATLWTDAKHVGQQIDELLVELSREELGGPPLADLDRQLARLASGESSIKSLSPILELEDALNVMRIENADRGANALVTDQGAPTSREQDATRRLSHTHADYFSAVSPDAEALRKVEEAGIIVLAQAQAEAPAEAEELQPATSAAESKAGGRRELNISGERTAMRPRYTLYNPDVSAADDPLQQPVNIDFRDMPLANVVNLLATKAGINVIAGTEVTGTVTANLQDIPLGQAIEIVLRQNGLGIIEESGIYRITTYEEAVASRRDTKMIFLNNASAIEVQTTIQQIVQGGGSGAQLLSVSANETSNILILSGPSELVLEFEEVVYELDIAEPVIPTRTETIKLNYSSPDELLPIITPLVSEAGKATGDPRSNTLVITDIPIKVEEIRRVVTEIDVPVKQVSISTMIVDAKLADDAQTGIDWTVNAIRHTNSRGQVIGNL